MIQMSSVRFTSIMEHGSSRKGDYIGEILPDYASSISIFFAPDRLIVHSTHILHIIL